MSSVILWALIAFLLVDILLIVLLVRGGRNEGRPRRAHITVRQDLTEISNAAVPDNNKAALPKPAMPVADAGTQFSDGGFVTNSQQRVVLTAERRYLHQRAHTLETRLADLNDTSDADTDYRRGMRVALEEELHAVWARLGEIEMEESRLNHVAMK